jgi:DNA-binding NarL/FixJ family response regulator
MIALCGLLVPCGDIDLPADQERKQVNPCALDGTSLPEAPVLVRAHVSKPLDADNNEAHQSQRAATGNFPERDGHNTIAVVDEHSFTRECITKSLRERCTLLNIATFSACDECLRGPHIYDLILYHSHESVARTNNPQITINIKKLLQIAPVIVLCDVDCFESVSAAFESGARGYIPTVSTEVELAVEIIRLVKAGGTFVPPTILRARAMCGERVTCGAITTQFTPRQIAVLECVKRGKTNKIIAHELKMSESTVKVHIHNIMKRLKATNRTEVAARAYELELGEPSDG